jgi:uroporphyrinogen-III synthase
VSRQPASRPGILVLRPVDQAAETLDRFQQQGWQVYHLPAMEIIAANVQDNVEIFSRLETFDWIIFVSQNAVIHFRQQVKHLPAKMPRIATLGKATTRAAEQAGFTVSLQPDRHFSSEGLLENPLFQQVNNQQILIVRGNGGREMIAQQLAKRGACVSYVEVYERRLPDIDTAWLTDRWEQINVVVATASQLLDNLVTLTGLTLGSRLYQTPVVVISVRMQQHAMTLGFQKIWLAEGPSNDQMITTINKNLIPE